MARARAIFLVDWYMKEASVAVEHFQLVGIAALHLAIKFDCNQRVYSLSVLKHLCMDIYSEDQILNMEKAILKFSKWQINYPTSSELAPVILEVFIPEVPEQFKISLVNQLDLYLDVCYASYEFLHYMPSSVAFACIFLVLQEAKEEKLEKTFSKNITSADLINRKEIQECFELFLHITSGDEEAAASAYNTYQNEDILSSSTVSNHSSLNNQVQEEALVEESSDENVMSSQIQQELVNANELGLIQSLQTMAFDDFLDWEN